MVKHELNTDHENKRMAKIIISDLHPIYAGTYQQQLIPEEIMNVLGGSFNIQIIAINYGFNPLYNNIQAPYNVYDNRINGADFSRQLSIGSILSY